MSGDSRFHHRPYDANEALAHETWADSAWQHYDGAGMVGFAFRMADDWRISRDLRAATGVRHVHRSSLVMAAVALFVAGFLTASLLPHTSTPAGSNSLLIAAR